MLHCNEPIGASKGLGRAIEKMRERVKITDGVRIPSLLRNMIERESSRIGCFTTREKACGGQPVAIVKENGIETDAPFITIEQEGDWQTIPS